MDASGNLYISDTNNNAIKKWSSNTLTTLASGLNQPQGVAVDRAGNVYFADQSNNAIKQFSPATNAVTTLVSGLNLPYGVAVDGSANVYFADRLNNAVKMWNPGTRTLTTLISTGLSSPYGVAVDGYRNLYIGDSASSIKMWNPTTQQLTTVGPAQTGFATAADGLGNVYATVGGSSVVKLTTAFLSTAALVEPVTAGTDSLPPVLPVSTPLNGVFAPHSDQAWLTIGTIANGIVNFSFTANTSGAPRTAHITVLGSAITVTQSAFAVTAHAGTSPQSAHVNSAFANPLAVMVKNGSGSPVSGVSVTFTAPASGASVRFSNNTATIAVVTSASGVASAPLTANGTGGEYTVIATAGVTQPVSFALANTGLPSSIVAGTGTTPQTGGSGVAFSNALAVTVRDVVGAPLSGVNVTFTAPVSGASGIFSNKTTTIVFATNASGVASAPITANSALGAYTMSASTAGLTAFFSLTNVPGPPASIVATAGTTPQSLVAGGGQIPQQLSVTVGDAFGHTVPAGVTVTFDSHGGLTFGNGAFTIGVVTNVLGVATAGPASATQAVGPYTATASVAGLTANFSLRNIGSAAAVVPKPGSSPQSTAPSTRFPNPVAVIVTDSSGYPLPGINVDLTVNYNMGAGGTFSNGFSTIGLTTDSSGVVSTTVTATNIVGAFTVTAEAIDRTSSTFPTATLSLANHGAPASVYFPLNELGQFAEIGTYFPLPLTAIARDALGIVVPGVTVTFTVILSPTSGASGTFSNLSTTIAAVTDATGTATAGRFKANSTPGSYDILATIPGVDTFAKGAGDIGLFNIGPPVSLFVSTFAPFTPTAPINTTYQLLVIVNDEFRRGVPGQSCTFTAPTSGASGTFSNGSNTITVTADGFGNCFATLKANSTVGAFTVRVTSQGTPGALINLTNTAH